MIRRAILGLAASIPILLAVSAAQAAVVRFSVELGSAGLHFEELYGSDGSFLLQGDPGQEGLSAVLHPLRGLLGQAGTSILEINALSAGEIAGTPSEDYTHALSCLSGVLCGLDGGGLFSGYGAYRPVFDTRTLGGFRYRHGSERVPTATSWFIDFLAGTGSLSTFHDGDISGGGTHGGVDYVWWAPGSTVSFTNVRIIPNPLPTPVLLLVAGLVPLALLRRRDSRRVTRNGEALWTVVKFLKKAVTIW